jgi:hypothetical protein
MTDEERLGVIRAEKLEELEPTLNTKPRVFYKNLYRFTRCFIGGSVTSIVNGVEECVEGAQVTLCHGGVEIGRATTDAFGDFKFDGIEQGTSGYTVKISHSRFGEAAIDTDAQESEYLGEILLSIAA